MMRLERYTSAKRHQWDDFIRTSRNGFFMFERNYMEYHADRFEDHSLMAYDEQDKLVAVLPANRKDDVLHSHQGLTFGGFIVGVRMRTAPMLVLFDALKEYGRVQGLAKVNYKVIPHFYHRQPAQEDLYALSRCDAQLYRTDMSSTIDLRNKTAFSSSRKSGLAKARTENLEVAESDDFSTFFNLMDARLSEKYDTKATHNAEEMALLASRFPGNIRLHACFQEKTMLAGSIVYETDIVAHTQYIGATEKGRVIGATDFLLDHLINARYAHKRFFDFGISTEQGGKVLNENLIAQKEGFGGRATVHQFFELTL